MEFIGIFILNTHGNKILDRQKARHFLFSFVFLLCGKTIYKKISVCLIENVQSSVHRG